MLPLIDTPVTLPGWVDDLAISPSGRGGLFAAKNSSQPEWEQMMNSVRQLFIWATRSAGFHLLGLVNDKGLLNEYLTTKESILRQCFLIEEMERLCRDRGTC